MNLRNQNSETLQTPKLLRNSQRLLETLHLLFSTSDTSTSKMGFSKSLIAGQVRKPRPRRVNIIQYLGTLTSSPPQPARIPTASRFVAPRWLRWFPPTTAVLQRRTTKRLYFWAARP